MVSLRETIKREALDLVLCFYEVKTTTSMLVQSTWPLIVTLRVTMVSRRETIKGYALAWFLIVSLRETKGKQKAARVGFCMRSFCPLLRIGNKRETVKTETFKSIGNKRLLELLALFL